MFLTDETVYVWWVYPDNDVFQHATKRCPPHDGGGVTTLCSRTIDVPPAGRIQLRPFCATCLWSFLSMRHSPIPLWAY